MFNAKLPSIMMSHTMLVAISKLKNHSPKCYLNSDGTGIESRAPHDYS